jgi:hypothetical protein
MNWTAKDREFLAAVGCADDAGPRHVVSMDQYLLLRDAEERALTEVHRAWDARNRLERRCWILARQVWVWRWVAALVAGVAIGLGLILLAGSV